jgi:hypothetical protein
MDENPMNHTCFPCNMPNKSPPSFHSSILPQTHDLLLAISHVLQDPHGLSLTVYTWLSDCHLHREALGIVESIKLPPWNALSLKCFSHLKPPNETSALQYF